MVNNSNLLKKIKQHIAKNPLSFHTPGHKGGQIVPPELADIWPVEMWKYDLTEISELDNLHKPSGCLKEAQEKAATVFKAQKSYFLVNGTSIGIQAAIMAISRQKPIFVPRHVHKSVYNGIILADAKPIYLPVTVDNKLGIPLGVEPAILKTYLQKYPDCKNIILPNPNYQGISYKIEETIALAKQFNLQIIIDEAHGSHFCFNGILPESGLALGADLVVQSWHKTLPTLTQASVLHLGKGYKGPDISLYINLLQTTSPSYLLLASLDAARAFMEEQGRVLLEQTIKKINKFKLELKTLKTIKFAFSEGEKVDLLKLGIYSDRLTGYQLAKILEEQYQIFVELAEENYCLLIFGIGDKEQKIASLQKALEQIDRLTVTFPKRKHNSIWFTGDIPDSVISLKEAFYKGKEIINISKAEGRICGDFIINYPPGIPLIVPGERVSKEILNFIAGQSQIKVVKE